MGVLKNLFKKTKADPPVAQAQQVAAPASGAGEVASFDPKQAAAAPKPQAKPKHGEDGVCCGSCQ